MGFKPSVQALLELKTLFPRLLLHVNDSTVTTRLNYLEWSSLGRILLREKFFFSFSHFETEVKSFQVLRFGFVFARLAVTCFGLSAKSKQKIFALRWLGLGIIYYYLCKCDELRALILLLYKPRCNLLLFVQSAACAQRSLNWRPTHLIFLTINYLTIKHEKWFRFNSD